MKKIICIIFLVLASYDLCHATKRALVIGIGNYPKESGWAKINGDKDLPMVKEMLLANGFQQKDIIELENEKATARAIRKELDALVSKATSGDIIYIHFSGHGQQITDLQGDEEDGFDESWIPYDAQFSYAKGKYEGENHIIDDQLNQWLTQLRTKIGSSGKITVVADACHSGGGSRGDENEEEYVIRGTSDAFIMPGKAKPFSGEIGIIDWIFISACKSYQCNYEYKGTGSLTYALFQQKDNLINTPCLQIKKLISHTLSKIIPFTQTPVVETSAKGTQQSLF